MSHFADLTPYEYMGRTEPWTLDLEWKEHVGRTEQALPVRR